ncbi:MAG: ribonuclease H-like domain-containing protein [Deltaproteobacteria bacterium]|nr:ribonuclease H-like domain-containing protein [Deltaproteobacteria bacterium]
MSVRKRLQRLTGERPPDDTQSDRQRQINELRRRIEAIMSRRPEQMPAHSAVLGGKHLDLHDVIEGAEIENSHGQCFLVHRETEASAYHGHRCIRELSTVDMASASLLANNPEIAACNFTEGLFLDTETTGLSGGTGTFAFLIGLGWFEGDSFITQQIFARDFSEERACLVFLKEVARNKRFLVTFNGKSFDVGLLTTRFIMNRISDPLSDLPHLDLLYPSRRMLGHRLDNSRLVTLEREVLGLRRRGDIPGSEIPQRYFDWLRRRDGRLMVDVVEHNRLDVISMATLTLHLAELLSHEIDMDYANHSDLLAVARLFADRGYDERAQRFLGSLMYSEDRYIASDAGRMLALIYKRAGRWNEAVKIWEKMLMKDPCDIFAVEELAKWYEHREHNFERALSLVTGVLENVSRTMEPEREALVYRLNRLRRRLGIEG